MTDAELIARLRDEHVAASRTEAADRIEALVKDKEQLGREVNMARYGQPDLAWSVHKEAMADLEAKLAKAVEALGRIARQPDYRLPSPQGIAQEALAEIKGESQ